MKRLLMALFALVLLIASVIWFQRTTIEAGADTKLSAPTIEPENKASAPKLSPVERMQREEQAEEALEALSHSATKEPLFETQTEHFVAPLLGTDGSFLAEQTRLEMDPSCAPRLHKPDGTRSAQDQLLSDYGIKGERRVPEDVFFESLTQFFTVKEQYYQLTARAKPASRPPRYDFEFYVAADAGMLASVTRIDVPVSVPENLDVVGVRSVVEETLALFSRQGAVVGARLMQVRVTGAPGESDQEISYFNATPTQWAFGSGVCQLHASKQSALCRCLPDGETQPIPHY